MNVIHPYIDVANKYYTSYNVVTITNKDKVSNKEFVLEFKGELKKFKARCKVIKKVKSKFCPLELSAHIVNMVSIDNKTYYPIVHYFIFEEDLNKTHTKICAYMINTNSITLSSLSKSKSYITLEVFYTCQK